MPPRPSERPILAGSTGGAVLTPPPQGSYVAVCCDVVDLGVLETTYQNEKRKRHMVRLYWQLDERREDGTSYIVSKRYTLSLHEKSALRKDLEAWRGRQYTAAEIPFDLNRVIGHCCLMGIIHRTVDTTTYGNITSLMPLPRGTQPISIDRTYVRKIDREDGDQSTPDTATAHVEIEEDAIPF